MKTKLYRPYVRRQLLLLGWCLLLLTNCGQPIQLLNRTPRASSTRLVATSGTPAESTVIPNTTDVVSTSPLTTTQTSASDVGSATVTRNETSVPTPVISIIITPQLRATPTGDERWAAFVRDRVAFEAPQRMMTLVPSPLLWLDPRNGQVLEIGMLNGSFAATARMVLTSDMHKAYEVEYTINQDYGLTAISDAIVMRMRDAGYTASVRAFVVASDNIVQAP